MALPMEKIEAVVEGIGVDISDFNDAADRHLVHQQLENVFVFVMFPLPSGGLDVLGQRLSADIAAPSGVTYRGFAERGICTDGTDRNLISIVGTGFVVAAHRPKRQ